MNYRLRIFLLAVFLFLVIGRVEADEEGYKSLGTARLLSAVCPGAGQFYVHNYWKGALTLGIEGALIGTTVFSFSKIDSAPDAGETAEGEMSKEDYKILGWTCGITALGYYIFQIWRLNDDVVVYNYKKRFLEPTSLRLNLNSTKCSLILVQNF